MVAQNNSENSTSSTTKPTSVSIMPETPNNIESTPVTSEKDPSLSKSSASVTPENAPSLPPVEQKVPLEVKNAQLYKVGIVLLLIILLFTIGIFYMRTQLQTVDTDNVEASPSPSPEVIEEVIEEVTSLEREDITLEILNGTSTSGLAGKTSDIFEKLGYKVKRVGNTDDTEDNQLYVKTEFADQLDNLLKDVKEELDITKIREEVDDLDTTARIILGEK